MSEKPVRKVTVLLTEDEFEAFDEYCRRHGSKKSTLLAQVVRDLIAQAETGLQGQLFSPPMGDQD